MRNALLALAFPLVTACSDPEIAAPTPTLSFSSYARYGGFDDSIGIDAPMAVGPGSAVAWYSDWSGECQHSNFLDGDTTESCDAQTYLEQITLDGVAYTIDDPGVVEAKGEKHKGAQYVTIVPSVAGTLSTTATITRGATVVTQASSIAIVQPDSLVLECRYEVNGQWPYTACPTDHATRVPGEVYLFYAYGKNGDQLVDVSVELAPEGFVEEPDTVGLPDTMFMNTTGPGTYTMHAAFGALTADYTVTLE